MSRKQYLNKKEESQTESAFPTILLFIGVLFFAYILLKGMQRINDSDEEERD